MASIRIFDACGRPKSSNSDEPTSKETKETTSTNKKEMEEELMFENSTNGKHEQYSYMNDEECFERTPHQCHSIQREMKNLE